jgi:perosamine synthetase
MSWKVPLFKIYTDENDIVHINNTIKTGMNWAVGSNIEEFEKKISDYNGSKYCVVFNSGTSALHAILMAYGINKGDEVIVPSFTFIATANAPLFVGAKPVFADIEEKTYGLDPEDVKIKINKKTKAIIPIHYAGCPCRIKEIKEIAEDKKILLFEDAAESFGASINNKKVGTFGDSSILSFCQNKIITTGDGGAVITDSNEIYEKLKLIRSHGRLETSDYFSSTDILDYVTMGYNFRMSNITAALGISQLEKVNKIINMRKSNAKIYTEKLKDLIDIVLPVPPKDYDHVYQMYTIRAKNRDKLMKHLADSSIMTKVYFSPVHLTHFYKNVLKYSCKLPKTEEMAQQVVTLPMYPTLTDTEIEFVVDKIKQFYQS